ncbi:MAG: dienelactone hydrolase [Verrucomicrobiales bacterium]|nr:dienelactone hydrolase [Verrucomicrobiales bacterium]
MRMFRTAVWLFLCTAAFFLSAAPKTPDYSPNSTFTMETVAFRGVNGILNGYLYKPLGRSEPFPVVIFYRDSRKPLLKSGPSTQFEMLARFWVTNGYAVFIPDHQPRTTAAKGGESIDLTVAGSSEDDVLVQQLQEINKDVVAATEWVKAQAFADESHVIMMGTMIGASQTIMAAEKGLGVKAFIPFSPGTLSWSGHPMLQALLRRGVRTSKVPIFIIQTQNDKSLAPSAILGKELMNKGAPNRAKVFPPFGVSNEEARNFALTGCSIWGPDVIAFLKDVLPQ